MSSGYACFFSSESGHRFIRKCLSEVFGDNINVMIVTVGYNFKRPLKKLKHFLFDSLYQGFIKFPAELPWKWIFEDRLNILEKPKLRFFKVKLLVARDK